MLEKMCIRDRASLPPSPEVMNDKPREREAFIINKPMAFDKNFIVSYFDERVKATNNQLLKYRYNYFISLLTNDNRYAKPVSYTHLISNSILNR